MPVTIRQGGSQTTVYFLLTILGDSPTTLFAKTRRVEFPWMERGRGWISLWIQARRTTMRSRYLPLHLRTARCWVRQVIDADGSPYTNQLRRRSNPIKRDGRNQRPPYFSDFRPPLIPFSSRDEVQILVPGNGSVRPRPARFLSSSPYAPRQSSSFIPKSEIVVRGTASSQQRKRVDHPHAKRKL